MQTSDSRPDDPGSRASSASTNAVTLDGVLCARGNLRYTPGGVAMLDARLHHQGAAMQAGHARQLDFEMALVFAGTAALEADRLALGQGIRASGFLAPTRKQARTLALNVLRFDPVHAPGATQP